MNPPPPPARPINPSPFLVNPRAAPPADVPVQITRGFPSGRLADVERDWGPSRASLAAGAAAAGVHLEHREWDWANKGGYYPPEWHCLVAVEAGGEVQGLMAVETRLRPSVLTPGGWVVYVAYVEAAPWNLEVPGVQPRRYEGVGTLLIAEAVRMSMGRAAGGRVGLHALPQAEGFYAGRCRMTPDPSGPDTGYGHLLYFEYPDGVTAGWLTDRRFSA